MTVVREGIEYVPAFIAAEELSTTEIKILMLLKQRALSGEFIDGCWYVTKESLASYHPSKAVPPDLACKSSCSSSTCGCR